MLFKLSNMNSNLVLTLVYLNPALNNSAQVKQHLDHGKKSFPCAILAIESVQKKFIRVKKKT